MMAVLFAVVLSVSFTSCDSDDDITNQPVSAQIAGSWYANIDITGETDNDTYCTTMVYSLHFDQFGTGYYMEVILNKFGEFTDGNGGHINGKFQYTIADNGAVSISVDDPDVDIQGNNLMLINGKLTADGKALTHANAATEQRLAGYDELINAK